MPRRLNPLVKRFRETFVAISNVFRCPSGSGGSHTRIERSKHIVIEYILRGHGCGLVARDPVERMIQGHSPFAVLKAKVRD